MTQSKIYFALAALFFIVLLSMILSCGGNSADGGKINKYHRDTSKALVVHMGYGFKSIKFGPAKRVSLDTLLWVGTDSSTMKKKQTKLTYYLVDMEVMTDSTIAALYKIPELDSTGKRYAITITGVELGHQYVRDSVSNFDSAVAYLKQFIPKADSTKK